MTTLPLRVMTLVGFLAAVLAPQTALAAQPAAAGPIGECLRASTGTDDFLACLELKAAELQEQYGFGEGWQQRLRTFIANHPDWRQRLAHIADRMEDRRDRREDRHDRREDRRDRMRGREDFFDRREDRRDRRQDRRDKWEERWEWRKERRGQA